ncbi:MAG: SRPBCC family protein [Haloarculaceae archaeon]
MVMVTESIHVDEPVDRVFEFMDDPANHAMVTPSLADVRNVERKDNGGKRLEYTFNMVGVSLDGELDETVHEENERMIFELRGALSGEIEFSFEPAGNGTELTYTARYEIPGRVLSIAAEPFVRRYNERELATTLSNVKTRLETDAAE